VQPGEGGLGPWARVLELAREGFQQHQAKGVNVGRPADRLAGDLFRRQIGGGAHGVPGAGGPGGVGEQAGDAEVGQLGPMLAAQEHVAGLDVAVHDVVGVYVGERLGDLDADGADLLVRERAFGNGLGERGPVHELHHQIRMVEDGDRSQAGRHGGPGFGAESGVQDRDQTAVGQPSQGAGLVDEPRRSDSSAVPSRSTFTATSRFKTRSRAR